MLLTRPALAVLLSVGAPGGPSRPLRLASVSMCSPTENFRDQGRGNYYNAAPGAPKVAAARRSQPPTAEPPQRLPAAKSAAHLQGNPLAWATEHHRVPAPFVATRLSANPAQARPVPQPTRGTTYDDMTIVPPPTTRATTYDGMTVIPPARPDAEFRPRAIELARQPAPQADVATVRPVDPAFDERARELLFSARAIDLESDQLRKQAKAALEARVAKARTVCDTAVDERAREVVQAAIDDYFDDKIDEEELKRRKQAARQTASAEHDALSLLEGAYGAYTAATAARSAALKAEDEAADILDEALRAIEEQGAS